MSNNDAFGTDGLQRRCKTISLDERAASDIAAIPKWSVGPVYATSGLLNYRLQCLTDLVRYRCHGRKRRCILCVCEKVHPRLKKASFIQNAQLRDVFCNIRSQLIVQRIESKLGDHRW